MGSKYFFQDHKEQIEKENSEMDAHEERVKIDMVRCKHKDVQIINREVVCSCGAAWTGTPLELQEAYEFFTKQN